MNLRWTSRRAYDFIMVAHASVIISLTSPVPVALGADRAVDAIATPPFAKNVRVSIDGDKLSLDEAIRRASADPELAMYRQLRAEHGRTADGQLELARWCRKRGREEERLHWQLLLMLRPDQPDAIKGLGLRRYQGRLMTKPEIEAATEERKLARAAERKWGPKLKQIKLAIEQGDAKERAAALVELEAIRDPHALALVEKMFADRSDQVAMLVVEMYARAVSEQSTAALVRLAIHADDAAVRKKAAGELGYRPMESYMPALMGGLAAPIELSFRGDVERGGPTAKWWDTYYYTGRLVKSGMYGVIRLDGNYTERDMVYWWGPETKPFSGWLITGYHPDHHEIEYVLSSDSPDPNVPYEFRGGFEASGAPRPNAPAPESIRRSVTALEKRIHEWNEEAAEMNLRIDAAIRAATKADPRLGQPAAVVNEADVRPRLWWDWWQNQLKLNNYVAKGTEVWTQLGIMPIEDVLVGDRVLTKNLDTGALSFNLVIGIDMQPDRAVTTIEVGTRTIMATADQPFFVATEGWRKAGELKSGMQLDAIDGSQRVQNIRSGTADAMYSLLIANLPNYFADRQGILVHDATRP